MWDFVKAKVSGPGSEQRSTWTLYGYRGGNIKVVFVSDGHGGTLVHIYGRRQGSRLTRSARSFALGWQAAVGPHGRARRCRSWAREVPTQLLFVVLSPLVVDVPPFHRFSPSFRHTPDNVFFPLSPARLLSEFSPGPDLHSGCTARSHRPVDGESLERVPRCARPCACRSAERAQPRGQAVRRWARCAQRRGQTSSLAKGRLDSAWLRPVGQAASAADARARPAARDLAQALAPDPRVPAVDERRHQVPRRGVQGR